MADQPGRAELRAAFMVGRAVDSAWLYVQDQGDGVVSFVGSSRLGPGTLPEELHPLRFGSARTHQFVVGGLVLRPALVIGTDALIGTGLGGLATSDHDIERMLRKGEIVIDEAERFRRR